MAKPIPEMQLLPRGGGGGKLYQRVDPCPYMTEPADITIYRKGISKLGKKPTTINVQYIAYGSYGCVYFIRDGFPNPFTGEVEQAVVKTPRNDGFKVDDPNGITKDERDALRDTQRLFFEGFQKKRLWVVMKWLPGLRIWDHPAYRNTYPEGYNVIPIGVSEKEGEDAYASCRAFLNAVYDKVVAARQKLFIEHGWDVKDENLDNYLFTRSDRIEDADVNIVDLGLAERVQGNRQTRWPSIEKGFRKRLQKSSQLTFADTFKHQGICQSNARDEGQPFESPGRTTTGGRDTATISTLNERSSQLSTS